MEKANVTLEELEIMHNELCLNFIIMDGEIKDIQIEGADE